MPRESKWIAATILFLLTLISSSSTFSLGQRAPIQESTDKRFARFGDGTVLDRKTNLLWMAKDYRQLES